MDALASFVATVLVVSLSGVLVPGPLLAAGLAFGVRNGARAGLLVALGHATVELPLVLILGLGIIPLESFAHSRAIISILGAIGLFVFAIIQARSALRSDTKESRPFTLGRYGAFVAGVTLSALNPFFLTWWATIGLKLVADSQTLWPVWGPEILFALHIPLDIVWLCFIAALAKRGSQLARGIARRVIELGLALGMSFIGIIFVLDAIRV